MLALLLSTALAPALAGAKADVDIDIRVIESASPGGAGGGGAQLRHTIDYDKVWTSGTIASTADTVWSTNDASFTTTPTDYDLRGSMTSKLTGATVTFTEVVCVIVKNESTTGSLQVGGDAAGIASLFGAAADYVVVGPGGLLVLCNPSDPAYATTATTADILQITASTGTVVGDVVILGRSA